jgi:hypothetical protein
MALVTRHRIPGLADAALRDAGIVPGDQAQVLAAAALHLRWQNRKAAAETIRVQALLQAQGILTVVFKGAALAQLAYGSLDTKHSCDVDLLLSPDKVRAAAGLLMAAGYRLVRPAAALNDGQWGSVLRLAKEVALAPPDWGPAIELHWTLGQDSRLTTWLSPRAPAREIVLPGHGTVRTFEDSDLFAYLCVHGAGHLWIRLKWLADFHALTAVLGPEELERRYLHAVRRGVGPAAALALAMCERIFGLALPPASRQAARSRWAVRQLERLSLAALLGEAEHPTWTTCQVAHHLLAREHGYLWRQSSWLLTGLADTLQLQLPRPLHFLYPLLRLPLGLGRRVSAGLDLRRGTRRRDMAQP